MILPLSYGEYIGVQGERDLYCIGTPQHRRTTIWHDLES